MEPGWLTGLLSEECGMMRLFSPRPSSARMAMHALVSDDGVTGAGSGVNGVEGSCEQLGP